MIRLLLVDDHETFRFSLALCFGAEPDIDVIGTASDGISAVAIALSDRPDVVLMDMSMPQMDGLTATRLILAQAPSTRVLVLSMYAEQSVVREAFDAGARGYLVKSSGPDAVLEGIRAVHRGQLWATPPGR